MTLPFHHRRFGARGFYQPPKALPPSGLLASVLSECVRVRREQGRPAVTATLDVCRHHEQFLSADLSLVRRALEPLVRRAFESAAKPVAAGEVPVVPEVIITSVDVGDAIEIEVADSGPPLSDPVKMWLGETTADRCEPSAPPEGAGLVLAAVRAATARIGGTLHATNCPDGGVAITLRLTRRQSQRQVA